MADTEATIPENSATIPENEPTTVEKSKNTANNSETIPNKSSENAQHPRPREDDQLVARTARHDER